MSKGILIFTDNYPFGKSEPFLETELDYISRSFDRVAIIPFEAGKDKIIRKNPENIEILTPVFDEVKNKKELLNKGLFNTATIFRLLKEGIRSGIWLSGTKFRIWATHMLVVRSLSSDIKNRDLINIFNQFDVIYFYWGLRWSQILPFLPPYIKPRIIVRFHGSDLYEHTNNGYIPWRREQLSRINKAIAVSETGKKYIESRYPFLKDRILISRIGTNDYGLNKYIKSDTVRIVSCSNLVPVKRVGEIVKTLSLLKIPVNWVHFGDGPEMEEIKILASSLPGNITAELKGAVGHDVLMDYYRNTSIDLFLNVSSSEGVPVSVMEALSFGIPVVATDVGGTGEIVSDKTGLLINAEITPEDLALKIEELIKREDYSNLRSSAREAWDKKSKAENVYPEFIDQLLKMSN
jgi:colanic acid/amylovoran biosynthesis glycosyltransferase